MKLFNNYLDAENELPFLKGEYPLDIQEWEYEVMGQPKCQDSALYRNARNQKKLKLMI